MSRAIRVAVASLLLLVSALAQAQAWPSKPVRIIAPFAAGGLADVLARSVAEKLSASMGATFIVENRVGAGGNIGADIVAAIERGIARDPASLPRIERERRGAVGSLVRDQLAKTGVLKLSGDENGFVATPQLGAALSLPKLVVDRGRGAARAARADDGDDGGQPAAGCAGGRLNGT